MAGVIYVNLVTRLEFKDTDDDNDVTWPSTR